MRFWKAICTYFIHKKNKSHSIKLINELLETFGFAEEQPELKLQTYN